MTVLVKHFLVCDCWLTSYRNWLRLYLTLVLSYLAKGCCFYGFLVTGACQRAPWRCCLLILSQVRLAGSSFSLRLRNSWRWSSCREVERSSSSMKRFLHQQAWLLSHHRRQVQQEWGLCLLPWQLVLPVLDAGTRGWTSSRHRLHQQHHHVADSFKLRCLGFWN